MGKNRQRVLGVIPVKNKSKRFPNKNFYEYSGKLLWEHAYDNLSSACNSIMICVDPHKIHKNLDQVIERPTDPQIESGSVIDILIYALKKEISYRGRPDIVACLFPNTINFCPDDCKNAINIMKQDDRIQEVRGFHYDGTENGLLIFRTDRLLSQPGISSYLHAYICHGREIHTKDELEVSQHEYL